MIQITNREIKEFFVLFVNNVRLKVVNSDSWTMFNCKI